MVSLSYFPAHSTMTESCISTSNLGLFLHSFSYSWSKVLQRDFSLPLNRPPLVDALSCLMVVGPNVCRICQERRAIDLDRDIFTTAETVSLRRICTEAAKSIYHP